LYCGDNLLTKESSNLPSTLQLFKGVNNPWEEILPTRCFNHDSDSDIAAYWKWIESYECQSQVVKNYGVAALIDFKDHLNPEISQEYPQIGSGHQFGFFE
jgi:hypothetical protein